MVWDDLSESLATRLQKLQNRAGRWCKLKVCLILEELGWSDLKTRRAKHKATQIFKISVVEAPSYLTDKFFNELNVNLPSQNTDFMKRSFAYPGIPCLTL